MLAFILAVAGVWWEILRWVSMLNERLVYIVDDFDPTFVSSNVGMMIRKFVSCGMRVSVLTNLTEVNSQITEVVCGVSLIKVRSRLEFSSWLIRNLSGFDCVFTYNTRRVNTFLVLLRLLFGKRLVIKTDRLVGLDFSSFKAALRSVVRIVCPLVVADIIIYESPAVFDRLRPFARSERSVCLPNCVPVDSHDALLRRFAKEGGQIKEKVVLFVGRVSPEKGIDILINAFDKCCRVHGDWRLEIVGPIRDSNYYSELRILVATLGLEEMVAFRGDFYGEELYRWYHRASIFCLPSLREGMPNVIPDAMFFGCAVVASDVGEIGYQLDGSGLLVSPGSATELCCALERLVSSAELRDRFGAAGRARVVREFSMMDRYASLEALLASRLARG